ncbi:MAG: beta-galactosidase trimerization domain-containing protein [Clostridia bacterium]|nr:beta-galactosidase trimerization domain-containing protein [Clostridia bacterium]
MEQNFFESGKFFIGCNWWASHAGTNMWHDWNAAAVEADIKRLKEAKIDVMRVFPLWSDFQPLRMHFGGASEERELRLREDSLPDTEAGRAGVDEVMAERFGVLCDIAERYGMKLIVGLITGWMSGRMHMPEAFAGRNLITDPMVVTWQIKFVKYMVRRFKDKKAIAAWDLGNECNCLQALSDRYTSYAWAAQITNAIKAEDPTRLVVSGMHGNRPENDSSFNALDLGEILDILCTHPYPIFTPHCDTDPLNEMKTILHSTAESVFVGDVSGKPCFVEEIGTLGPMISSEAVAADYIRAAAFSSWAHDLRGFVWWCANEQKHLTHTPYDWNSVERELGLFHLDGTKKPVLEAMTEISEFTESFEYGKLPPRIKDAVVVLTRKQDTWAAAYGSFILAKQAGLDVEFVWHENALPESNVYILPSLVSDTSLNLSKYNELIDKAKNGATLVMSIDDALLSPFSEITGLSVITRQRRSKNDTVTLSDGTKLPFNSAFKLVTESIGADVLLYADDGTPAVTSYKYGEGRICFIASPIEYSTATLPSVVSGADAIPYYKIYSMLGLRCAKKCAQASSPYVCVTEHPCDENERILTVLNYRPSVQTASVSLKDGFKFKKLINVHGTTEAKPTADGFELTLEKNTGVVIVVAK